MSASKRELAMNAARWMEAFKKETRPSDRTGAIFIFFSKDDPEASAVCVASINNAGVADACRGILKKIGRDPDSRIVKPGDFQ